jgi:Na+-transporting methylmalonyl-CoA/oxaloacetate decarboxylase gamma subunit
MDQAMISAVQITIAGMGLVFIAILVLWLVMALLVKLTGSRSKENLSNEAQQAAAAAVTFALAERAGRKDLHEFPLPPTAIVSAWQAVNRGKMLNKRGSVK